MKVIYNVAIRFKVTYEIDTVKDLKTAVEFATGIGEAIADEVASIDGVAFFDVESASQTLIR